MQFRYIGSPANDAWQYVRVNCFFPFSLKLLWHNIPLKIAVLGKTGADVTACIYDSVSASNHLKNQTSNTGRQTLPIMTQAFQKLDSARGPIVLFNLI